MEYFFSAGVVILFAGFIWFYVARPMLVDFGWIRDEDVNDIDDRAPVIMSRSEDKPARLSPSSLETAELQTPDQTAPKKYQPHELLTVYTTMKHAGISRDAARAALNAIGVPLDNNLWARVPAKEDDDTLITPYAGRVTKRSFYPDDPDLEYKAP